MIARFMSFYKPGVTESKVTDQELNWMYAALVKKQVIDSTYIMVERWICEASSGTGEVGSRCYLTLIARAMNPGLAMIQKYYVPGRDIGIEHLRHAIISEGMKRRDSLFLRWIFPSPIKG